MWNLNFLSKAKGVPPLLLRLYLGYAFFAVHGMDKIRPDGKWDWAQGFVEKVSNGTPAPLLYVAAWTELLAGFAVLLGLLTRWAALGLCGVMAGAVFMIHWDQGFNAADGGYEMATVYGVACLALAFLGPGSFSLDRLFFGKEVLEPRR